MKLLQEQQKYTVAHKYGSSGVQMLSPKELIN
jgi:hypothetical protein